MQIDFFVKIRNIFFSFIAFLSKASLRIQNPGYLLHVMFSCGEQGYEVAFFRP